MEVGPALVADRHHGDLAAYGQILLDPERMDVEALERQALVEQEAVNFRCEGAHRVGVEPDSRGRGARGHGDTLLRLAAEPRVSFRLDENRMSSYS